MGLCNQDKRQCKLAGDLVGLSEFGFKCYYYINVQNLHAPRDFIAKNT